MTQHAVKHSFKTCSHCPYMKALAVSVLHKILKIEEKTFLKVLPGFLSFAELVSDQGMQRPAES